MSSSGTKDDSKERKSPTATSQKTFEGGDSAPAMTRRNHRREMVRAAALRLEQQGGECDSAGNDEHYSTKAAISVGSSSTFLSIMQPAAASAATAALLAGSGAGNALLGSGIPPSPMVTPPTASQSAPRQGVAEVEAALDGEANETSPSKAPPSSPGKKGGPVGASSGGGGGCGVPHIYHDFGQVPDEPGYIRKKTGGVTQPFPEKLYEMLESEGRLRGDVVEWLPHGRAFIVRRPKDFTDRIMPKYVGASW
jgi:HSF-type DNA-binding